MKRTSLNHIVLLAAIFHLFADVALAGGAVLCVGPNDHTAIEIGHLAPGCETLAEASTAGPTAAFSADTCTECTDSPLHAEPEMASKRISSDIEAPALLTAHVLSAWPASNGRTERLGQGRVGLWVTSRAHSSIVLLI